MMNVKQVEDFYPLSFMQQGLLFHSLYETKSDVYFEQVTCVLQGGLNIAAFERSWQNVVARHPVLRTSFVSGSLKAPVQVVNRAVNSRVEMEDWRDQPDDEQQRRLREFLDADRKRGFDFAQAPLMRLTLIAIKQDHYQFVWSHHHVLLDGWSVALLLKEVASFYRAFSRGQGLELPPARAFKDYIVWLNRQDHQEAERYWKNILAGFSAPLSIGIESSTINATPKQEYLRHTCALTEETTAKLRKLTQRHQVTLNTILQGSWAILLSRLCGESDIVFGTVVSGRPTALTGIESMIGVFINTLPVRTCICSADLLFPWLKRFQAQQAEARQYDYIPLFKVQGLSDIKPGTPLFESLLTFENYPVADSLQQHTNLGDKIQIRSVQTMSAMNYPISIEVEPGKNLLLKIDYKRSRYESDSIARIGRHLTQLLENMAAEPGGNISDLEILSRPERHQLHIEWNDTQIDCPNNLLFPQLFEAQVERTPDAAAIVLDDQVLTYRGLNASANRLARLLLDYGVGQDVIVGLLTERGLEFAIAIMATFKAGGAYLPLDPRHPAKRIERVLDQS